MTTFNLFQSQPVNSFAQSFRGTGPVWIFHHIAKTAGTSIVHELNFCLPPYFNMFVDGNLYAANGSLPYEPLLQRVQCFLADHPARQFRSASGQLNAMHMNIIRDSLPNARMFTFLRDPAERLFSAYRYYTSKSHPGNAGVKLQYPTFETYIDAAESHNLMWRLMIGQVLPFNSANLRQVFNRYAFIGTVEHYNLCFELFTGLSGCPKTPSVRANVTENSAEDTEILTTDHRAQILLRNPMDAALFAEVSEILAAKSAEMQAFIDQRRAAYAGRIVI